MKDPRVTEGDPGDGAEPPASWAAGPQETRTDEGPLADPAHRAARWFMVLAPVLLVVAVFLLLRLSTG